MIIYYVYFWLKLFLNIFVFCVYKSVSPSQPPWWTCLVVGPRPKGRALRNVIFPEIQLGSSLLLPIQKERIKQRQWQVEMITSRKRQSWISIIFLIRFFTLSLEPGTQYGTFVGAMGWDWLPLCNVLKSTLCWVFPSDFVGKT